MLGIFNRTSFCFAFVSEKTSVSGKEVGLENLTTEKQYQQLEKEDIAQLDNCFTT